MQRVVVVKKIARIVLFVLASHWFAPVIFLLVIQSGMEALCRADGCVRDLSEGEAPDKWFEVMVRLPSGNNKIVSVGFDQWPRFLKTHPGASLLMQEGNGKSADGFWAFRASPVQLGLQSITAKATESNRIELSYLVDGSSVRPLRSKIVYVSYMFWVAPVAIIVAWLVRRWAVLKRRSIEDASIENVSRFK